MTRLLSLSLLLIAVLFSGVSYGDTGIKWRLIKNGKQVSVLNNRDHTFRDGNWLCSSETPAITDGVSFRGIDCRNTVSGHMLRDIGYCGQGLNDTVTYPMVINGNEYQLRCTVAP